MPTIEDQKRIETFPPSRANCPPCANSPLGATIGPLATAEPSVSNTRSEPPPYVGHYPADLPSASDRALRRAHVGRHKCIDHAALPYA